MRHQQAMVDGGGDDDNRKEGRGRVRFKVKFSEAVMPQLSLSMVNSLIVMSKLSADMFLERAEQSPRRVSVSVVLMNMVGCWFNAIYATTALAD